MAQAFNKKRVSSDIKRVYVIIPAAGIGSRMGTEENKQFIEIKGIPVITRTLQAFKEFASTLFDSGVQLKAVVVTHPEFVFKVKTICKRENFDFVHDVVEGGATRTESVWNGIEALQFFPFPPTDNDVIFIHDGARCLVDQDLLYRCLAGASSYDICAAAVDVKSTIKKVEPVAATPEPEEDLSKLPPLARLRASSFLKTAIDTNEEEPTAFKRPAAVAVEETPKRNELKEVQTPQVFRYNKLLQSYANAMRKNIEATDDTSLAEAMHYKVTLIEGSYNNIKITTPDDISMAELILNKLEASAENQ